MTYFEGANPRGTLPNGPPKITVIFEHLKLDCFLILIDI